MGNSKQTVVWAILSLAPLIGIGLNYLCGIW